MRQRTTLSSRSLQRLKRAFVLPINLVSLSGCVLAAAQAATGQVGMLEVALLLLMYTLTAVGVSVGFHRYFSHTSFKTTPAARTTLAILGSMAAVGPIISWVATHRCHHRHSDLQEDPHSPNLSGPGWQNRVHGLWHAHIGWLLDSRLPNSSVFAKDLLRDRVVATINRTYPLWIVVGLAIPALLGGLVAQTWQGAFQGFVWGGLVRMFLGFHAACCINSIAHALGRRPFNTREHSGNLALLALPTFGESWHNNHHAFPRSARFGLRWSQVDLGYMVICALEALGLAWDVRKPSPARIESKIALTHL